MTDSVGDTTPQTTQPATNFASLSSLTQYVHSTVTSILEESGEGSATLLSVLEDQNTRELIKKFISDPQIHTLIVQKLSNKDDEEEVSEGSVPYSVMTDVRFSSPKTLSIVFIKRGPSVEADKSFSSQFRFLNFTDGSPYETLHSMISDAISPFYKSYIRESGRAERDGDKMAPSVEKTMTDLEMGLLHLQQNIDIPEISLSVHPLVAQIIRQKADAGSRAKTSDFEDKLEDAHFLNTLQSGVNRWIKEIQKVTKLDRDPASGTALQEITFWLNLERSLVRIQEKRESLEVTLTLDILKHAKRFHALVSFDNDTGLQQALATVADYNPLMKDFPLNDLLSATELDKIRLAVQSVFTHLRKIRNTKYPIQRALRLIEAISRDLCTQLLKVLGTRRLMHMPFEEFEHVMVSCFEVFTTWDEEYDRLQGLMRDIIKKKREEPMRMVWRSNPAHRRLQIRLDHMRNCLYFTNQTPTVILSLPQGFDPSGRIEDMASEHQKQLASIAIGSAEGFSQADKAINSAAKSGKWVMLKNVHLAPGWLVQLEKKLHNVQPHPNFRLFLTMEINPKIPINLLRAGRVFVFEPPPGIKSSLLRTFASIPASRITRTPAERCRLYFLLAWFNAVVQERLRYVPLGWSKRYEFNESDLKVACDTVDTWVDSAAMGRTNIPPAKVPWAALRTLLGQSIYGGKIDNLFDQRLMETFLSVLFTEASFEHNFQLVQNVDGQSGKHIFVPEGSTREALLSWIQQLPDIQTPSWLGLPNNAEKVLLTNLGQEMTNNLLKLQEAVTDDESLVTSAFDRKKSSVVTDSRPAWMRQLLTSATSWLCLLPKSLKRLTRTTENLRDPLYRFFEREVNSGANLLSSVRHDLEVVIAVCSGEQKPTNRHRNLMSELVKGLIPDDWQRYTIPKNMTVIQWINDFALRIKQLIMISETAGSSGVVALQSIQVWLGGLFMPEAYITATRQFVAQSNGWALEELYLDVSLVVPVTSTQSPSAEAGAFVVRDLWLMGAEPVNASTLCLSDTISVVLPFTVLKWIRLSTEAQVERRVEKDGIVRLPVYMNGSRSSVLFTVQLATKEATNRFYERGVALLASFLA
ncbi:unnamed protein product [Dicrocoelium dendriticum]|nr:unnamed protein product [Dicrocoelium dendriticum]